MDVCVLPASSFSWRPKRCTGKTLNSWRRAGFRAPSDIKDLHQGRRLRTHKRRSPRTIRPSVLPPDTIKLHLTGLFLFNSSSQRHLQTFISVRARNKEQRTVNVVTKQSIRATPELSQLEAGTARFQNRLRTQVLGADRLQWARQLLDTQSLWDCAGTFLQTTRQHNVQHDRLTYCSK